MPLYVHGRRFFKKLSGYKYRKSIPSAYRKSRNVKNVKNNILRKEVKVNIEVSKLLTFPNYNVLKTCVGKHTEVILENFKFKS